MKIRNILILAILGISISIQAQEYKSAIGLRLGFPTSISYKMFISEPAAIEIIAGYRGYTGYHWLNVGGFYQHHTPIASVNGLSWYLGGGLNAYFWSFNNDFKTPGVDYASVSIGISGCLGLDYKFDTAPINISVDWLPTFAFSGYVDGFDAGYFGLAVRYVLN